MDATDERRDAGDTTPPSSVRATVTCVVGADEVEFDAAVVRISAHTVLVELGSGLSTLAVASTPVCELQLHGEGVTVRADAHPGRRIADVPDSHQLELVIADESVDLTSFF